MKAVFRIPRRRPTWLTKWRWLITRRRFRFSSTATALDFKLSTNPDIAARAIVDNIVFVRPWSNLQAQQAATLRSGTRAPGAAATAEQPLARVCRRGRAPRTVAAAARLKGAADDRGLIATRFLACVETRCARKWATRHPHIAPY